MKKKNKIKHTFGDRLFSLFIGLFMIAFVIITLYPVLNTVAISFNDGIDAVRGGIYLWPRKFAVKNYTTVLGMQNLVTGAKITVARTVIGAALPRTAVSSTRTAKWCTLSSYGYTAWRQTRNSTAPPPQTERWWHIPVCTGER